METEIEIEEVHSTSTSTSTRSLRIPRISSVGRDSEIIDNLQYTSLKDIICNSPTKCSAIYDGNVFDSNIAIRNVLVKRAASVYLQSAALLATRNQNCFVAFWERLKNRAASYSRWGVSECFKINFLPGNFRGHWDLCKGALEFGVRNNLI
ncbi:hypothetical protein CR513_27632, partial [Mucuna pruriens]